MNAGYPGATFAPGLAGHVLSPVAEWMGGDRPASTHSLMYSLLNHAVRTYDAQVPIPGPQDRVSDSWKMVARQKVLDKLSITYTRNRTVRSQCTRCFMYICSC